MSIPKLSSYLPTAYQQSVPLQHIYTYLDEYCTYLDLSLSQFISDYLTIATATTDGLDFQAQLNGLLDFFWSKSWNVEIKRTLIMNYRKILTERGNRDLVSWLFTVFSLNATLSISGGWIIGVTVFTQTFSGSVFNYQLKISQTYLSGTPERTILDLIVREFVPDFITLTYIYV